MIELTNFAKDLQSAPAPRQRTIPRNYEAFPVQLIMIKSRRIGLSENRSFGFTNTNA
jgi:hypothetical protein